MHRRLAPGIVFMEVSVAPGIVSMEETSVLRPCRAVSTSQQTTCPPRTSRELQNDVSHPVMKSSSQWRCQDFTQKRYTFDQRARYTVIGTEIGCGAASRVNYSITALK